MQAEGTRETHTTVGLAACCTGTELLLGRQMELAEYRPHRQIGHKRHGHDACHAVHRRVVQRRRRVWRSRRAHLTTHIQPGDHRYKDTDRHRHTDTHTDRRGPSPAAQRSSGTPLHPTRRPPARHHPCTQQKGVWRSAEPTSNNRPMVTVLASTSDCNASLLAPNFFANASSSTTPTSCCTAAS